MEEENAISLVSLANCRCKGIYLNKVIDEEKRLVLRFYRLATRYVVLGGLIGCHLFYLEQAVFPPYSL